jgi:hypothetical protein
VLVFAGSGLSPAMGDGATGFGMAETCGAGPCPELCGATRGYGAPRPAVSEPRPNFSSVRASSLPEALSPFAD